MVYWHVAKETSFKAISILAKVAMLSAEPILVECIVRNISLKFILNLDQLFRRRGHLKIFLIYSADGLFVQCFQTICAIMVVGLIRNISVKQYIIYIMNLEQWFKRKICLKAYHMHGLQSLPPSPQRAERKGRLLKKFCSKSLNYH